MTTDDRNVIDLEGRRSERGTGRSQTTAIDAEYIAAEVLDLLDELRIDYGVLGRFLQRVRRRGRTAQDVLELQALLLRERRSTPTRDAASAIRNASQLPLQSPPRRAQSRAKPTRSVPPGRAPR